MVLKAVTKIIQSPNSNTQYLAIPADMVKDSQYPFSPSEEVEICIIPGAKKVELIGTGIKAPSKSSDAAKKAGETRRRKATIRQAVLTGAEKMH